MNRYLSVVRVFTRLLIFLLLLAGLSVGAAAWWLHNPMSLNLPEGSQVLDLEIEPGTRAARLIRAAMTPDDDAPAPKPAAAAPPVDAAPKATPPAAKKQAPEPAKPAAAPAKKIPNSVFSLSDL